MIRASVCGAGPAGAELIRILIHHPDVEIASVCDPSHAGERLDSVVHGIIGEIGLTVSARPDLTKCDVLFIADDNISPETDIPADLRIIDMTGSHYNDENFVRAVCELNRKALVRGARCANIISVAAQGALLATLPLAGLLLLNGPIGVSVHNNSDNTEPAVIAAEIRDGIRELQNSFDSRINVITDAYNHFRFTCITVTVDCPLPAEDLEKIYHDFYDDHNFTFVIDHIPAARDVANSNKCMIHLAKDGSRLLITAAFDPLVKGCAGTAVHAMNLLFGLYERTGLNLKSLG